jgi:homoserine O-acetyltransferase
MKTTLTAARRRWAIWAAATSIAIASQSAGGQSATLEFANLGLCRLDQGAPIRDCRIGYRTHGRLDATRSNVVLVPTWFSGTTADLETIIRA